MSRCWERTGTPRGVPVVETIAHLLVPTGALAAVVLGLALAGGAAPAAAHARVSGSTPADGEVVATPPAEVQLRLEAKPGTAEGDPLQVYAPDGRRVDAGGTVVSPDRRTLTVRIDPAGGLPAGEYRLMYRVVSADTHIISGRIAFTATEAVAAGSGAAASVDDAGGSADPIRTARAPQADRRPPALAADAPRLVPAPGAVRAAAIAGGAAAVSVVALSWLRRRRSRRRFEAELADLSSPPEAVRRPVRVRTGFRASHGPARWPATTPERWPAAARDRPMRPHTRGTPHRRAVR